MRILYGVQGTGNGHLTRARALSQYFESFGIGVDYLFSGRAREQYFAMEPFGDHWLCHPGLTFSYQKGRLSPWKTLRGNRFKQFWRDLQALDLSGYDLVLTDFEPISAWAARRQGKTCIGVGHQYAFNHRVPTAGENWVGRTIMEHFAPVDIALGLHWHHFNAPILPPITDFHKPQAQPVQANKIVVYLGFEEMDDVLRLLRPFEQYEFVVYGAFPEAEQHGHVQLKPLSREGFRRDLLSANGVICNAGFELSSEAIQLGKKLLVKPLQGQMEQLSNARALEELGLGMAMQTLNSTLLEHWLKHFSGSRVCYPNVARAIVQWLSSGDWETVEDLSEGLWSQVHSLDTPTATDPDRPLSSSSAQVITLQRASAQQIVNCAQRA